MADLVVIGGKLTTMIPPLFIPTIHIFIEDRVQHEKVKADEPIAEGLPELLQPQGAD